MAGPRHTVCNTGAGVTADSEIDALSSCMADMYQIVGAGLSDKIPGSKVGHISRYHGEQTPVTSFAYIAAQLLVNTICITRLVTVANAELQGAGDYIGLFNILAFLPSGSLMFHGSDTIFALFHAAEILQAFSPRPLLHSNECFCSCRL